ASTLSVALTVTETATIWPFPGVRTDGFAVTDVMTGGGRSAGPVTSNSPGGGTLPDLSPPCPLNGYPAPPAAPTRTDRPSNHALPGPPCVSTEKIEQTGDGS